MASLDSPGPWSASQTGAFRWFTIFSLLFIAPIEPLTNLAIPWIGHALLGLEGEISLQMTGSGDTTAEYVRLLLHVVLATCGAVAWTVLRGPRARYVKLLHWFTFALRVTVSMTMIGYGVAKLTGSQFSPPTEIRLFQDYGDSSPMGLLWTFMGHSTAYSAFTGLAEILGAVLLLSRRTTTLGAVVVVGVMANVVMLNFCYDVPVKLLSSRLLLWAVFLAALDGRRLYALFANTGTVASRVQPPLFTKPKAHLAGQILKSLLALFLVLAAIIAPMMMAPTDPSTTASVRGVYEVTSFERDGVQVPPLVTDENRWHRVAIGDYDSFAVFGTDGVRRFYRAKLEGETLELTLLKGGDQKTEAFAMTREESGEVRLVGETTSVTLRAYEPEFLLRDRGFHWVQEAPFNR